MQRVIVWFFIVFASSNFANAAEERRVALVVGNATYEQAPILVNPINDAVAIGRKLETLGFDVVSLLDVDQNAFIVGLETFREKLSDATHSVFYFAGHGIQVDGQNHLISTNARLDSRFRLHADTIALDQIIEVMESASPVNMIFLDACRDNPFVERLQKSDSASRSATITQGLAPMSQSNRDRSGSELMVMFATSPNRVAEDGAGENSPFAEALLRHIGTPSAEVSLLLKRVIKDVRTATESRQSPEILSSMSVEFFFNTDLPEISADITGGQDPIYLAYNSAKNADTSVAWAAFLQRYPEGFYTDLARDALIAAEGREAVFNTEIAIAEQELRLSIGSDEQKIIQRTLKGLGYYVGAIDGQFGPASRTAIEGFQREWGLSPTGYVEEATREVLHSEKVQTSIGRQFSSNPTLTNAESEAALNLSDREIRLIFAGLGSQGYDPGSSRYGLNGTLPRSSIRQYQFKKGLEPSNFLNAELADELIALGRKNGANLGVYLLDDYLDPRADPRLHKAAAILGHKLVQFGYFENKLYIMVKQPAEWDAHQTLAERLGGHLAVFSSQAEKRFIDQLVGRDSRFFTSTSEWHDGPAVGYYQKGNARSSQDGWVSVTGESVRYLNWFRGQPNELRLSRMVGFAVYGGEGRFNPSRLRFADQIRFRQVAQSAVIEIPLEPVPTFKR